MSEREDDAEEIAAAPPRRLNQIERVSLGASRARVKGASMVNGDSVSAAEFGDRFATTPYLAALDRRRHQRHPPPPPGRADIRIIIDRPDRPSSIVAPNLPTTIR